jgi:hypothetical protein
MNKLMTLRATESRPLKNMRHEGLDAFWRAGRAKETKNIGQKRRPFLASCRKQRPDACILIRGTMWEN